MKEFSSLLQALGSVSRTSEKLQLLEQFFLTQRGLERSWAFSLLCGKRLRRTISSKQLREWCAEFTGLPMWLIDESYHVVGDLAETLSLLVRSSRGQGAVLQEGASHSAPLSRWMTSIEDLALRDNIARKQFVMDAWRNLPLEELWLFGKLLTGALRVGVARALVLSAVSRAVQIDKTVLAQRCIGAFDNGVADYDALVSQSANSEGELLPVPFALSSPLDGDPLALGPVEDWFVEWKWDGIRAQLVFQSTSITIFSRGEEVITEQFPELQALHSVVPKHVILDGELLVWHPAESTPRPFLELQRRLQRKRISAKLLQSLPIRFVAYDIPIAHSQDLRERPLVERRRELENVVRMADSDLLMVSPSLTAASWDEVRQARESAGKVAAEGVMLKHHHSPYQAGRRRGFWWKWKKDPYTFDGVLLYAQKGHGRRADLFTDYTFGVWYQGQLVSVAKAYSGLTNEEIQEVDRFIKSHTAERFGPVRTVEPHLVFEIAFEGIQESPRHKSGIALRFPRILRWRRDKGPHEADSLESLRGLLDVQR